VSTITNADSPFLEGPLFFITTNSSGQIINWNVVLLLSSSAAIFSCHVGSGPASDACAGNGEMDQGIGVGGDGFGMNMDSPGTWAGPGSIPEPSSLYMVTFGAFVLLGLTAYRSRARARGKSTPAPFSR
jgi:hypothetical protein